MSYDDKLTVEPIFFFYSDGTKRSPHVRIAIIAPTKNPTEVTTLIFPGSFSGEKTSVRKNLEKERKKKERDWTFFERARLRQTLRMWTHLGRAEFVARTEGEEGMMVVLEVLSDEPWFESRDEC